MLPPFRAVSFVWVPSDRQTDWLRTNCETSPLKRMNAKRWRTCIYNLAAVVEVQTTQRLSSVEAELPSGPKSQLKKKNVQPEARKLLRQLPAVRCTEGWAFKHLRNHPLSLHLHVVWCGSVLLCMFMIQTHNGGYLFLAHHLSSYSYQLQIVKAVCDWNS